MPRRDTQTRPRMLERPVLQPLHTHVQVPPRVHEHVAVSRHQMGPSLATKQERVQPQSSLERMQHALAPQTELTPSDH